MDATGTTDVKSSRRSRLAALVVSIGREARRLDRPLLLTTIVSIGSALLSWYLWFSAFVFDSARSFLASVGALVFILVPGAFLVWVLIALRDLALLPTRIAESDMPPEEAEASRAAQPPPGKKRYLRLSKARADAVLELWAHLSLSKEEILELRIAERSIRFFAHPSSTYLVGGALIASALLASAAAFSTLSRLLFGGS